jgi:Lon protease-like protein
MASRLLPLFPLNVVVFPRTRLPLHIFEERYKTLIGDAIRDRSEFGIVLATEQGIVNAGCTVVVDKVLALYPDGRMDIVTRGSRRFEIQSLDDEQDCLRAEVEFFDDEDAALPQDGAREVALAHYEALAKLRASSAQPDLGDPQLSFQLAQTLPDLDFLSLLLRLRSESERLRELNRYLEQYLPQLKSIERVKHLAPTNGHGAAPPGF